MKLSDFHRLNLCGGLLAALLLAGCADAKTFPKLTTEDAQCSGLDCRAGVAECNDDGECNGNENPANCPSDCPGDMGPYCGDGTCDPGETPLSCDEDCTDMSTPPNCGNGTCDDDETPDNCPADCGPRCGDGTCDDDEDNANCAEDCPAACGDHVCDDGETRRDCPSDCCDVIAIDPTVTDAAYTYSMASDFDLYQGDLGNLNGGAQDDWLAISFWKAGRYELGQMALSAGDNATWANCEQCVQLFEDLQNDGTRNKTYFQTDGVLEVGGARPASGASVLRMHGVVLTEVSPDDGEPLTDANASCYFVDGAELTMPMAACGDGVCSIGEMGCPADCSCGNGTCDPGETPGSCTQDCGAAACGNGRCEVGIGEDKMTCPQDCCEVNLSDGNLTDLASVSTPGDNYFAFVKTFDDISGGPLRDLIEVEFYANADKPADGDPAVEWDLGSDMNRDYATCSQCVLVLEDHVDPTHYGANYFQRRGRLQVGIAPETEKADLLLRDTVLVESTIDWDEMVCHPDMPMQCQGGNGTYASMTVPGGRCVYLDNVHLATP